MIEKLGEMQETVLKCVTFSNLVILCDQETGNKQVIFMQLDLASLKSVRSFVDNFLKSEPRLDILINNAGQASDIQTECTVGVL